MKKVKLTERFGAKLLAWFLLAISIVGLLCSAVGIVEAWELNVYSAADREELLRQRYNYLSLSLGYEIVSSVMRGDKTYAANRARERNAEFCIQDQAGTVIWESDGYAQSMDSPYAYRFLIYTDGSPYSEYNQWYPRDVRLEESNSYSEAPDYLLYTAVDPALPLRDSYYWTSRGITLLWELRYAVYVIAGLFLLLGAVCFVFLLCAAGHRAEAESLTPGYLTKIPFDLFTAAAALLCIGGVCAAEEVTHSVSHVLSAAAIGACLTALALIVSGWCTSFALRVKLGKWWENTLVFRLLRLLLRGSRAVFRGIGGLLRSLPLVWRTALAILGVTGIELFLYGALRLWQNEEALTALLILEKLLLGGFLLYLTVLLRRLQKGGEALASGDLQYKTDVRGMFGDFRRHGEHLNSAAAGMSAAVERQTRSERMKTELITNVSHDIKTPLTSIINYVDFLKEETDPAQREEYVAVLDRQAKRLKKLTEDLIEASKASTGNVELSLSRHSVHELLRQAVGEYAERLSAAGLEPVLTLPETELFAEVDGTAMWRILDNLLSNACKYAQSGTRLYAVAQRRENNVVVSFKNVSREPLNISPEELMERFVRGDRARSGEGSGLGLGIARSLTELQHGTFNLWIDGDLFKVDLIFPEIP